MEWKLLVNFALLEKVSKKVHILFVYFTLFFI